MQDGIGDLQKVDLFISSAQDMEDELEMLGLKVKYHEDNVRYLKNRMNAVDRVVLDLQVILGNFRALDGSGNETTVQNQTENQFFELISQQTKTASNIIFTMKTKHPTHMLKLPTTKGVLGLVAMLGKVKDDNLSSLLSEYLGPEAMLAIVCKTYEDVKALEEYDINGKVDKNLGLHALGLSIGIPIDDRFLVICLEKLRPYVGGFVVKDLQKRLEIIKPRLPSGECPLGFIGFAVNMIDLEDVHLSCVTKSGWGLRETLFYSLFSRLQVYETRGSMQQALPYISDGAISLDGGIVKNNGIFKLGSRKDSVIKFPISSLKPTEDSSEISKHTAEAQEKHRLLTWKKDKLYEDIRREEILLNNVKKSFTLKKNELLKFQAEASRYVTQNQVTVHQSKN